MARQCMWIASICTSIVHAACLLSRRRLSWASKDEVIKADLGKVLLKLEALQADAIKAEQTTEAVVLDDEETAAAMALLKAPDLLERIQTDFSRCGVGR